MKNLEMLATLGLCTAGLIPNCNGQVKEQKRPNILFIMSDDHAYQAISAIVNIRLFILLSVIIV